MTIIKINPGLMARRELVEWTALIAVLALIGLFFTYQQFAETSRTNASESDRLHVLTAFVGNDIAGNLRTVSNGMEGVTRDYLTHMDQPQADHFLTLRLQALESAIVGIRAIIVVNAKGLITYSSNPVVTGKNVSDRAFFEAVRANPQKSTLYISAPFQSIKPEPDIVVAVSRMVPGPNDKFAGMVSAILDRDFFSQSFTPVVFAPDVWALVVHGDGRQIFNFPVKPGIDGTDLNRPETLFSQHRQTGQVESLISGKVFTTGEARMMAFLTVQPVALHMDRPIVIGLSRTLSAIALPLRNHAINFVLLMLVIVSASCCMLYWMQSRRAHIDRLSKKLEQESLDADSRLRVALRGANLGLWSLHVPTGERWADENSFALLDFTPETAATILIF